MPKIVFNRDTEKNEEDKNQYGSKKAQVVSRIGSGVSQETSSTAVPVDPNASFTRTNDKQSTTTFYTNDGRSYSLTSKQYDWIRDKYKSSWEYGYDDDDVTRRSNGKAPSTVASSYGSDLFDQYLLYKGLPSSDSIDDYIEAYNNYFSQTKGMVNFTESQTKWLQDDYKNSWEYDLTNADDIVRKSNGLMPVALDDTYGDTELDDYLRSNNLPSASNMGGYIDSYNEYADSQGFYSHVANNCVNLDLCGIKDTNDALTSEQIKAYANKLIDVTGKSAQDIATDLHALQGKTGHDLYVDAFYDTLESDEYSELISKFVSPSKSTSASSSDVVSDVFDDGTADDYAYSRGQIIIAARKDDAASDKAASGQTISYDYFKEHYDEFVQPYYDSKIKMDDGSEVSVSEAITDVSQYMDDASINNAFAAMGRKSDVDAWIDANSDRSASEILDIVYAQMQNPDNKVSWAYVRRAKNYLLKQTDDVETKKAINAKFAELKTKKYQAETEGKISGDTEHAVSAAYDYVYENYGSDLFVDPNGKYTLYDFSETAKDLSVSYSKDGEPISGINPNVSVDTLQKIYDDLETRGASEKVITRLTKRLMSGFDEGSEQYTFLSEYSAKEKKVSRSEATSSYKAYMDDKFDYLSYDDTKSFADDSVKNYASIGYASINEILAVAQGMIDKGASSESIEEYFHEAGIYQMDNQISMYSTRDAARYDEEGNLYTSFYTLEKDARYGVAKYAQSWSNLDMLNFNEQLKAMLTDAQYDKEGEAIQEWVESVSESGEMTEWEAYQTVSRNGGNECLKSELADEWTEAYYKEEVVPQLFGTADDDVRESWLSASAEERKNIAQDMWDNLTNDQRDQLNLANSYMTNPSVNKSIGEQMGTQIFSIIPRVFANTASGVISLADMFAGWGSGNKQWEVTQTANEFAASLNSRGKSSEQGFGSKMIGYTSDAITEMIRSYLMYSAGNVLGGVMGTSAKAASEGASKAVKLAAYAVESTPFVATAMGSYFSEAMQAGASRGESFWYGLVLGALEGGVERLNMDTWFGKTLGQSNFAKTIIAGTKVKGLSVLTKAKLARMVISFLGEASEEQISYVASTIWKSAGFGRYKKDNVFQSLGKNWSWEEFFEEGFVGGLTGIFGSSLQLGSMSEAGLIAEYMNENGLTQNEVDLMTSYLWYNSLSEAKQKEYADGGAQALSIEEYRNAVKAYRDGEAGISNAVQQYEEAVTKENGKVETLQNQLDELLQEASSIDVSNDIEAAEKFGKLSGKIAYARNALSVQKTNAESVAKTAKQTMENAIANSSAQVKSMMAKIEGHHAAVAIAFRGDVDTMRSALELSKYSEESTNKAKTSAFLVDLSLSEIGSMDQAASMDWVDLSKKLAESYDTADTLEKAKKSLSESKKLLRSFDRKFANVKANGAYITSKNASLLNEQNQGANASESSEANTNAKASENEQANTQSNETAQANTEDASSESKADVKTETSEAKTESKAEEKVKEKPEKKRSGDSDEAIAAAISEGRSFRGDNGRLYKKTSDAKKKQIAKAGNKLGRTVVFESMDYHKSGYYDGDNVLHINEYQAAILDKLSPQMKVFLHELTHSIEGSSAYDEYSEFVLTYIDRMQAAKNKASVDTMARAIVNDRALLAEKVGDNSLRVSFDGAKREIIADFTSKYGMTDESFINALCRQTSWGGRILNMISWALRKFGQSKATKALVDAEMKYVKAIQKAAKNGDASGRSTSPNTASSPNAGINTNGASQNQSSRVVTASDKSERNSDRTYSTLSTLISGGLGIEIGEDNESIKVVDRTGNVVNGDITADMVYGAEGLKNAPVNGTPIGSIIRAAENNGFVSHDEAIRQCGFFADIINMIRKCDDPSGVWALTSSIITQEMLKKSNRIVDSTNVRAQFNSLRTNADPQYATTIDFETICKKTQGIITAMSERMLTKASEGARDPSLSKDEIVDIYTQIAGNGKAVPCPGCYVFVRWMSRCSMLGNIKMFQNKYKSITDSKKISAIASSFEDQIIDAYVAGKTTRPEARIALAKYKLQSNTLTSKQRENLENTIAKNQRIIDNINGAETTFKSASSSLKNTTNKKVSKFEENLDNMSRDQIHDALDDAMIESILKDLENYVDETVSGVSEILFSDDNFSKKEGTETGISKDMYNDYLKALALNTMISEYSWLKNYRSAEGYKDVPDEILFDLNKSSEFSAFYPVTYAYTTSRGAAYGKAISPYSEAYTGDIVQGVAKRGKRDELKLGYESPFLQLVIGDNGVSGFGKDALGLIDSAKIKERSQALLNGQRIQSTSDFRSEYGLDYLIAFLDLQAIGAKVQLYTKVVEGVPLLAAMGAEVNLSVWGKGKGFENSPDGKLHLVFSTKNGMDIDAAKALTKQYDNAQIICVGLNDTHIKLLLGDNSIGFIIPYHKSGANANFIAQMYDAVGESIGTFLEDYEDLQSDIEDPRATSQQINLRKIRSKMVYGKANVLTQDEVNAINGSTIVSFLYARLYGKYTDGSSIESDNYARLFDMYKAMGGRKESFDSEFIKRYVSPTTGAFQLSGVSDTLFPYEYWDMFGDYDNADENGERFVDYCAELGLVPRFSGYSKKGSGIGSDKIGRTRTSEGIVYGDFSGYNRSNPNDHSKMVKGYWKTLIDRNMYNNNPTDGKRLYHVQSNVSLNGVSMDQLDPATISRNANNDTLSGDAQNYYKTLDNGIVKNTEKAPAKPLVRNSNGLSADSDNQIEYSTGMSWDELIENYGQKDEGEGPKQDDVPVPERLSSEKRINDFVRTALEAQVTNDDLRSAIKESVLDEDFGSYTQVSDKELVNRARSNIGRKVQEAGGDLTAGLAAAKEALITDMQRIKSKRGSGEVVTMATQLLAEFASRGDTASALDVLSSAIMYSEDVGRELHAFRTLKRLGSAGNAYMAYRALRHANETIDRANENRKPDNRMLPAILSEDDMSAIINAKTEEEAESAMYAALRKIGEQLPLTFSEKLNNWRYLSMLGNPVTHFRNILGNATMDVMRRTKNVIGAGIERVAVATGAMTEEERTHSVYSSKNQAEARNASVQLFEEHQDELSRTGKFNPMNYANQFKRDFDSNWLNTLSKLNSSLLENEDLVSMKRAFVDSAMQIIVARGWDANSLSTEQRDTVVKYATEEALKATFRDFSAIASIVNQIEHSKALDTPLKKVIAEVMVEGVMPFKKTPANIAKRMIEYSPIGLVAGVSNAVRNAYLVKNDKASRTVAASKVVDQIACGTTGTALMLIGMIASMLGWIRIRDDDDTYGKYQTSLGYKTYSLQIGNLSIAIDNLVPAAAPILMGAALSDLVDNDDVSLSSLLSAAASITNPMMELSFMSSLNEALKSYSSDDTVGGAIGSVAMSAVRSYASQYVPSVLGNITKATEKVTRTAKSSKASPVGSEADYWWRSIVRKIPGASAALLEPAVDVHGQEQVKDTFWDWALGFANAFILPTTTSIVNKTDTDDEIMRVFKATGNSDAIPCSPQKYFTSDGVQYKLNASQYTDYSEELGQTVYAALDVLFEKTGYIKASDEEKAVLIKSVIEKAEDIVRNKWKKKLVGKGK